MGLFKKAKAPRPVKSEINLKELNLNDLGLYLKGAFFRASQDEGESWQWVQVREVGSKALELKQPKGSKVVPLEKLMLDFTYPETGMFNYKHGVIQFTRSFLRKVKKGIYSENSVFYNFLLEGYEDRKGSKLPPEIISGLNFSFSPDKFEELFNSKCTPYLEAVNAVNSQKSLARAISRKYVISLGLNDVHPLLWHSLTPFAKVLSPNLIDVKVPYLAQELKDFLRDTNNTSVKLIVNGGIQND